MIDMADMRWSALRSIRACPSISCWAKSSTYSPQPGRFLMKSQTSVTFHLSGLPRRVDKIVGGAAVAGAEVGGGCGACGVAGAAGIGGAGEAGVLGVVVSFSLSFFSGGSAAAALTPSPADLVEPGGRPGPRLTGPLPLTGFSSAFSDFLRAVAEKKRTFINSCQKERNLT